MNRKRDEGFGLVVLVVAGVLVLVSAFAGWRVMSRPGSDKNDGQAVEANQAADTTSTAEHTVQDPAHTTTEGSNSESTSSSAGSGGSSVSSGSSGSAGGGSSAGTGTNTAPSKSFAVNMFNYGYSLSNISVKVGDKVTINLTNSGGNHDFVIDELNVQSAVISKGKSTSVTFTVPASAAGKTYQYYCSVGSHRDLGMVGNIVISG